MELPQASKRILLDSVDLVFMEAELNDIGRQVCRDLGQQVVGQVQQSEMIHVPEGLGVDLRDLVVDQKQAMKLVEAFKVVLLDLSDIIVLEVDYHSVFRNLLRNRDQTLVGALHHSG